jgi:hypothetical protein
LVFDNAWLGTAFGAAFAGCGAFGAAFWPPGAAGIPAVPGFAAGLINALCGTGSLPSWISVAFFVAESGSAGVALPCPGAAVTAGETDGAAPLALGWTFACPGAAGAG